MKLLYPTTLLILVYGWLITTAYAQPSGNYGMKGTKYSVPSGAYFASSEGTGSIPCSQSHPCSLSKALSSAPSGTTIVLRGGTYRTSSYNTKIPRKLTLQPYPGEEVILKGSEIANAWRAEGGDWKTSWKKLFPAKYIREPHQTVTKENPMAAHQDMLFVNGKPFKQVSSRSGVVAGTFYVDYANQIIYMGSDPTGKQVEITASTWGLHTYGVNVSGITVRGLKLMHYAECGIMLQSPDAVIENNEFTENAIAGMKIYGAVRATVRHNHFSKNGLQGAGINNSDQLKFEHNLVENNNAEKHNRVSWSAAGIKVLESRDCMIRNNLFRDNDANGIWLDHNADRTLIISNRIEREARSGIHCEMSNDAVIAGNVVTGCGYNPQSHGTGIEVLNSADVRVYNNTAVNNQINMTIADTDRPAELPQNETGARNVIVKNNLLSDATLSVYPSCELWVKRRNCQQAVVKELDHNGYHRSVVNQPALLVRWKVTSTCSDEERLETLAELQKKLNLGHNSLALTGNDPFFVDRSAGNFRLKSTSPAIKAGTAVPADIREALGWHSTASVDMGAYQSDYSAAPAILTGNLPWVEDFELTNSTYVDDGIGAGTAWSLSRENISSNAIFEVQSTKFMARGTVNEGIWESEAIKLGSNTVNFSVVLSSQGSLEANDYVSVFYLLDDGVETLVETVKGNISGNKVVTAKGIKGNTLQVIVKFRNSDFTEQYFLDDVHVEPVDELPAAPVGLATSNITCSGFEAAWHPVANADKYTVELYSDGALTRLVSTQTIASNTIKYSILANGTTYYLQVKAENAFGSSSFSTKVSTTTASMPDAPASLQATNIKFTQFDASWSAASRAEGYVVEVIMAGGNFDVPAFTQTVTTTTATFTGLAEGTSYQFRVRGKNSCGEGASVASAVFSTQASFSPPSPSTPSTPSAGNLPWLEDFNSTSYKGSVDKENIYKHGTFKVEHGRLSARGVGEVAYQSEIIKLNGSTVDISMVVASQGYLESNYHYDQLAVYYRIDNGSEQLIEAVKGNISSAKTIALSAVKGNTLQLIVRIRNSDISEYYFIDNIRVEATTTPTSPSAGSLPWVETFSSSKFKGTTDKENIYKHGTFKVEHGRLSARGVGEVAYQSEIIKLGGKTVNFSLQASSMGSLESNDQLAVYYRIDNGAERLAGIVKGNISSAKTIALSAVKGNTLQLIVRIRNSDISEYYFIDNIRVEAAGSNARVNHDSLSIEVDQSLQDGMNDINDDVISVYPNPFTSFIRVKVNGEETKDLSLVVLDMNGRKLYEEKQVSANEVITLDLSHLKKGMYLLKVTDGDGNMHTRRIIK